MIGALQGYNATHFLAAAIEKAGTTDTEAVADALEGLTIDTPVGETTIRVFDHQADPMIWVGTSTQSEEFPFPILTDLVPVSGSEVILSIAEVEARRAGN